MGRQTRSGQSATGRAAGIMAERSVPVLSLEELMRPREKLDVLPLSRNPVNRDWEFDPTAGLPGAMIDSAGRGLLAADNLMRGGENTEQNVGGIAELVGLLGVGGLAAAAKRGGSSLGNMGGKITEARRTKAPAEEIDRAAREAKGLTQPQLRKLYDDLGLSGIGPKAMTEKSLTDQPAAEIARATELKLADREALNTLSPEDRRAFQIGKLKGPFELPSQAQNRIASEEFAPVKKAIVKAEKEYAKRKEAGLPTGLFDTSHQALNNTPDVPQYLLPRVDPKVTDKLKPAFEGGGGAKRLTSAAKNAPVENLGWYQLDPVRQRFMELHGMEKGSALFEAWLDSVAGTSMVNPVQNNLRSASWYLGEIIGERPLPQVLRVPDPDTGKLTQTLAGGPPTGYGAKSQVQHAARVREFLGNELDPVSNPKPISFRENLSGNWRPTTVDTHEIRNALGMPYATDLGEDIALLPGEYSALEQLGQSVAKKMGIENAPRQAATWVGGGAYTGLKSPPVPLLEALNQRIYATAKVRGISEQQALDDFILGRQPLLASGAPVGLLGGADEPEPPREINKKRPAR